MKRFKEYYEKRDLDESIETAARLMAEKGVQDPAAFLYEVADLMLYIENAPVQPGAPAAPAAPDASQGGGNMLSRAWGGVKNFAKTYFGANQQQYGQQNKYAQDPTSLGNQSYQKALTALKNLSHYLGSDPASKSIVDRISQVLQAPNTAQKIKTAFDNLKNPAASTTGAAPAGQPAAGTPAPAAPAAPAATP